MKLRDDSMKLCVLVNEIGSEMLIGNKGVYLYYIPIKEYKKAVTKRQCKHRHRTMCVYVL